MTMEENSIIEQLAWKKAFHLARNISQFDEEIRWGVVVPSLCLDGLDNNASDRFALLPPLHDEILNLTHRQV